MSKWDGVLEYQVRIQVVFEFDATSRQDAYLQSGELAEELRSRVEDIPGFKNVFAGWAQPTDSLGPEMA